MDRLQPTDLDFGDELFDSFRADQRKIIYVGIIAWCQSYAERILQHRFVVEVDPSCRQVLKTMIDALTGGVERAKARAKANEHLLRYKERTPELERTLRDAILQFVSNPREHFTSQRIRELEPTDRDFDDALFDSLTAQGRLEVYSMLLLWCGYTYLERILERRVKVETDPACQLSISVMLSSFS